MPWIAACAPSGVAMVTKPNPRERPLVRSVIRLTSVTGPNVEKRSWRSFSVVSNGRFPTYNFVFMMIYTRLSHRFLDRSRLPGFKSSLNYVHLMIHQAFGAGQSNLTAPDNDTQGNLCKNFLIANPPQKPQFIRFPITRSYLCAAATSLEKEYRIPREVLAVNQSMKSPHPVRQ